MFALVRQKFGGKTPCKKWANLHPKQGYLVQRKKNILGLHNPLQKIGLRSAENNYPFLQTRFF
jgi:hypothetical protein